MNRHKSINRALLATAAAFGAALTLGVAPAVAGTESSAWVQLPLAPRGSLTNVTAVGTDTVFASTEFPCLPGESWLCGQTWKLNGTTWSQFKLPDKLSSGSPIAGTGANDVWFLGAGVISPALAYHWDGTNLVDYSPGVTGYNVRAAAAVSPASAWSVGTSSSNNDYRTDQAAVGRWNGTDWTITKLPAITGKTTTLNAVSASSENDVWASGEQCKLSGSGDDRCQLYVVHWDGTGWSQVTVPDFSPRGIVSIKVISRGGEVFIGGRESDLNTHTQPDRMFTLHWDGTSWTKNYLPVTVSADHMYSVLNGFAYRGSELFAGVSHTKNEGVVRWNGQAWEQYAGPLATTSTVTSLAGTVDGRLLVAGYGSDASGAHDFFASLPAAAPSAK
ncbi:hypothetical protein ACFRAR_35965 [Kitasatospora sp. NPDC056651]|uniref:hypothetical protein n=1 Tax=Kitasatospora sp. NPDC056651 TaxID=3345892 RepID=UPI0036A74B6F